MPLPLSTIGCDRIGSGEDHLVFQAIRIQGFPLPQRKRLAPVLAVQRMRPLALRLDLDNEHFPTVRLLPFTRLPPDDKVRRVASPLALVIFILNIEIDLVRIGHRASRIDSRMDCNESLRHCAFSWFLKKAAGVRGSC
jgi:hypothetical protein